MKNQTEQTEHAKQEINGELFLGVIANLWREYKAKPKKERKRFLESFKSASKHLFKYDKETLLTQIAETIIQEMEKDCTVRTAKKQTSREASREVSRKYYNVVSDALECYEIYQGDCILAEHTDEIDESVLMLLDFGEEVYRTGYAFENFGDISLIQNGEVIKRKPKDKVRVIGKVTNVLKPIIAKPTDRIETTKEIKIECSDCKRTGEGSEGFLKAQGWDLKRKLCLKCDLL